MAKLNPYQSQSPLGLRFSSSPSGYFLVAAPSGLLGFSKDKSLLKLLQKHGDIGDRLVASCTESSDRLHFVFQSPEYSNIGIRKHSYLVVEAPRAKSLSKTKSGTLVEFMAEHFPDLEAGWVPVAHSSNHRLILTKYEELPPEQMFEEYLIAHLPPVWWRTLFGFSYLIAIQEELNKLASKGYEVITFIGDDRYLLGKRDPYNDAATLSYRLEFIGNVLRVLFLGYSSTCEKRLHEMSERGWELVTCDYSCLLFKKSKNF